MVSAAVVLRPCSSSAAVDSRPVPASHKRQRRLRLGSSHSLPLPLLALFALFSVLANARIAEAAGGGLAVGNEWEEQRMCGRLLINALKTVCNHQYAQPNRDQLADSYYKTTGMVLRARRAPQTLVVRRRSSGGGMGRSRRGIIWECCTNKCSLNYIRNNYCAAAQQAAEPDVVEAGAEDAAAASGAASPISYQLIVRRRR